MALVHLLAVESEALGGQLARAAVPPVGEHDPAEIEKERPDRHGVALHRQRIKRAWPTLMDPFQAVLGLRIARYGRKPKLWATIEAMEPKDHCRPTPEYLRKYSAEHLWYEVWMFFQTGKVLPNGVTSPKVDFIENAILESFAIHLRNLLDFFYPNDRSKPHVDDI